MERELDLLDKIWGLVDEWEGLYSGWKVGLLLNLPSVVLSEMVFLLGGRGGSSSRSHQGVYACYYYFCPIAPHFSLTHNAPHFSHAPRPTFLSHAQSPTFLSHACAQRPIML